MTRDVSAGRRFLLDQRIRVKEQRLEDMQQSRSEFIRLSERYKQTLHTSFSTLTSLNEGLMALGSRPAQVELEDDMEKARYVRRVVDEQEEQAGEAYRRLTVQAEDEIEQVRRERTTLPW